LTIYLKEYDALFDEVFQCEISEEFREKLLSPGNTNRDSVVANISETPFPDIPIMSRYRSERHPGWDKEE
jgi:hypothetical protein